jgi:hypothetical protein
MPLGLGTKPRRARSWTADDFRQGRLLSVITNTVASIVVASGLVSCGPSHGTIFDSRTHLQSSAAFTSTTDPNERSENSRNDLPEFVMTHELPDVSRRLTNWLNTCWLHAGVKEMEVAYYRVMHDGKPMSVEHMLMNALHDRLFRIVQGAPVRNAELEAGGDMNEVRRLAREYGVIPEATWSQAAKPWGDMAKDLNPAAARLRAKYLRRVENGQPVDDVKEEAENLFTDILDDHDVHVPEWFLHNGAKVTPQAFGKTFLTENDQDYILMLAKAQYPTKPSKEDLATVQDGYLTTWSNIETAIVDQINQERSVLLSIYWSHHGIHIKKGVVTIDKDSLDPPEKLEGHVVNIVGYHLNDSKQLDRLKIENTWGRYEGSAGFYSISWKDLKTIYMAITIPDGFSYVRSSEMKGEVVTD